MPLEIRELHIRVNVSDTPGNQPSPGQAPPTATPNKAGEDRDQMLRECLDEVMHIIGNKKER